MSRSTTNLLIPSNLHNEVHFLRAVGELARQQKIIVTSPIYAESGMRLLEEGERLDAHKCEWLTQHRLSVPLDDQVVVNDAVDVRALQAKVHLFSGSTRLGRLLVSFLGEKHYMLQEVLRFMQWPARASFKLTVMRHHFPDLLEHSILMMMVAVALAVEEKQPVEDCAEIAAAALLHDVGMLYMPRHWTDAKHKLTVQEREQLASHSITSMVVLRSALCYSARAEDAVVQHHERLDGSGYPRHLKGPEISPWGHILMLAEVVSAFFSKFNDIPEQRLSIMLRMNHTRFDPWLMQHVFRMLSMALPSQSAPAGTSAALTAEVHKVIATLGAVFQYWTKCKRAFAENWPTQPGGRAGLYVDARMLAIEKSLAATGSLPFHQADWLSLLEEEPDSMAEIVFVHKEALWQVEACVEACIRRWPQLMKPHSEFEFLIHDWLLSCRRVLGQENDAASPEARLLA